VPIPFEQIRQHGGMPTALSGRPLQRRPSVVAGVVAGAVSLISWYVTMASVPRYSDGPHEDMGSAALFAVLFAAAAIGGVIAPRHARVIGVMLVAPALILSPWTAPRGDSDGLWILIVPMLALFMLVTLGAAHAGAWLRGRVTAGAR
jgi:hypothetical protein